MNNNPIGVFDSGIGGLTVLEKLHELMPNENYIYIADQKNIPYGTKTEQEVEEIVKSNVQTLVNMGCKAIVIACNTASLFVQKVQKITNIPVISVISDTCKYACETSKNGKIGVIATQMTIKNGKYQSLIKDQKLESFSVACSEFVDYLEHDFDDYDNGMNLVSKKLSCLKETGIDTLIFGCTHFGLLEDKIKKVLGELNYIDCGTPVSKHLKELLVNNNLQTTNNEKGTIDVYTTGDVDVAKQSMKWFKYNQGEIKQLI